MKITLSLKKKNQLMKTTMRSNLKFL